MIKILENRALNIVFFVLTIIANGLANGIPLNGQTTGQISAKYPSLFTPSGFTFSIWGLIYISLTAFVVYQMLPAQRDNSLIQKISPFFKASCIANAIWIFAWHYDALFLSLIFMACILFSLIAIYRSLSLSKNKVGLTDYIFIFFPFSLYTGWITVATIANISAVQTGMGWDDVGVQAVTWTLVKLAIAGAIGATIILRRSDAIFGLVVAWAAYGISVKQIAVPSVSGAALVLTILAVILVISELVIKYIYATTER
jgi:hypothetical protein